MKTTPRHPSKAARTILTTPKSSQDCVTTSYIRLILFDYLSYPKLARVPDRRTAIDRCRIADKSAPETARGADSALAASGRNRSLLGTLGVSVGMTRESQKKCTRRQHAASDRLLFLAAIAVGLYRAQIISRRRRTYDLKVNHKPVVLVELFSETGGLPLIKRHPVRQRYRMVEFQRWRDKRGLQFPASAGQLAVQCAAGGRPRDRGHRGRARSRTFSAPRFCRRLGGRTQSGRRRTLIGIADDSGLPGKAWSERSASEEIGKEI